MVQDEGRTAQLVILLAKSNSTRDHAHHPPTFTHGHDSGNDFANNINSCGSLHQTPAHHGRRAYTFGEQTLRHHNYVAIWGQLIWLGLVRCVGLEKRPAQGPEVAGESSGWRMAQRR